MARVTRFTAAAIPTVLTLDRSEREVLKRREAATSAHHCHVPSSPLATPSAMTPTPSTSNLYGSSTTSPLVFWAGPNNVGQGQPSALGKPAS